MNDLWRRCLKHLENELDAEDLHAWLLPLQATATSSGVRLFAPNAYIVDIVRTEYLARIRDILGQLAGHELEVRIEIGSTDDSSHGRDSSPASPATQRHAEPVDSHLDAHYTFATFVEGKSNQLGKAAAMQVAQNPGRAYNPLLLYGGTGLGKTHLMHAAGNLMRAGNPEFQVLYMRSEQFVSAMIEALRARSMNMFKRRFRSVDALLIDDIQLFAGKDTTQEEFFHTFNALFESRQQIILTCDRYPKEVEKLEPRLKSRLGWGLSVAIEPPDFETRAAILLAKASERHMEMPEEVAMLLAKRIRSNVRDLEGALNTLAARAHFFNRPITADFAQETLRDLLSTHAMAVTIANIQKTVADYYQVRLADLLSKRRVRSIARPRQMAMTLAKELTEHSLPEIGDTFGGRDHTTVLHACRTIRRLMDQDARIKQDWDQLIRILTS